jgi:CheY-like chemotaxis protein
MRSAGVADGELAIEMLRKAQKSGDPYRFAMISQQAGAVDAPALALPIKADAATRDTLVMIVTSAGRWREVGSVRRQAIDARLFRPLREAQWLNALAAAWSRDGTRAAVRPSAVPRRLEPVETVARSGRAPRVLVAEDNRVNQKVARLTLERLGIEVTLAGNGREAVQRFDPARCDLVLMDCQMPEVDGYAATSLIRRQEEAGHRVPIIALTADVTAECREQCIRAGMDDYIAKPLRPSDLVEKLRKWLPRPAPVETGVN